MLISTFPKATKDNTRSITNISWETIGMKQHKTKKRRSPWLHFAVTGIVLVVLSISLSQMLPKSHPLRALRKFGGSSDSASKPVEVKGAPLAVAGAIPNDAESEDKTSPKPENQTNAAPAHAPVSSIPKVGSEKSTKRRVHISHSLSRHSVVLMSGSRIGIKWKTRHTSPH